MHLYLVPMLFILIGLVMYTVLGGADFGAGLWQLTAEAGPHAEKVRDHVHHAIGPVWEANHVWLLFVLTVTWTAYPIAFASIATTLSVPLFIAGVGIILRGATYALRTGARSAHETRPIDTIFAASSILTPFALGTIVGAVASRRVPVGNAAGDMITSWLNPSSIMIGALAVSTGAYLAAVFLAADSARIKDPVLVRAFRIRALLAGGVAGALAIGCLAVLHADAHRLFHHLVHGAGLAALITAIVSGLTALGLVFKARYEAARFVSALAVAAIIAGWALAQEPIVLPGLTLAQAASPHDTLVLVVVAVLAGAAILFPSLGLLFGLVLRGRFDPNAPSAPESGPDGGTIAATPAGVLSTSAGGLLARGALASAIAGFGLLTVADAQWAHAIGVVCLLAFVILGFGAVRPTDIATPGPDEQTG